MQTTAGCFFSWSRLASLHQQQSLSPPLNATIHIRFPNCMVLSLGRGSSFSISVADALCLACLDPSHLTLSAFPRPECACLEISSWINKYVLSTSFHPLILPGAAAGQTAAEPMLTVTSPVLHQHCDSATHTIPDTGLRGCPLGIPPGNPGATLPPLTPKKTP